MSTANDTVIVLFKKIEELETQRDQYKELLREACEFLMTFDSQHREFLNKPEIKAIME